MNGFPTAIIDFAGLFIQMQDKRHSADYDPTYRLAKSEVETDIEAARIVIAGFNAAPSRHKRAFSTMVFFGKR